MIGGYYDHRQDKMIYIPEGPKAIADALRVSPSITSVSLLSNKFDAETAAMLLKVKEEHPKLKTLCGLTHQETELDFKNKSLGPADALMLAPEIAVISSITQVLPN